MTLILKKPSLASHQASTEIRIHSLSLLHHSSIDKGNKVWEKERKRKKRKYIEYEPWKCHVCASQHTEPVWHHLQSRLLQLLHDVLLLLLLLLILPFRESTLQPPGTTTFFSHWATAISILVECSSYSTVGSSLSITFTMSIAYSRWMLLLLLLSLLLKWRCRFQWGTRWRGVWHIIEAMYSDTRCAPSTYTVHFSHTHTHTTADNKTPKIYHY